MTLENRNSPPYLSKYGLLRAPFSSIIEHDMFYPESSRAQRLDILLHLSQYSDDILLVLGPEGSGKTTLLNQFLHKTEKTWQICQIDAHPLIDEEQLILRISHGFNLPVEHFDIERAEQDLKTQLQILFTKHDCIIIVVDNAQILNKNVLALLCRLAEIKSEHEDNSSIRLILFGQPAVRSTISQLDTNYRIFDLPPFDESASRELIHHRMNVAGAKDERIFSDANVNKIHKLSYGNPSKILEISHRILTEAPSIKRETYKAEARTAPTQKQQKNRTKKRPVIIVLALLTLITVILSFQDDINHMFTTSTENNEAAVNIQKAQTPFSPSKPDHENSSEKKTIVALKIPELNQFTKPKANEVTTDKPEQKKTQNTISVEKKPSTKISSTQSSPETVQKQETHTTPNVKIHAQTKTKPSTKPRTKPQAKTKAKTKKTRKITKDIQSEAWILKQNPQHRSLQLIAGYQYATLTNYIKKHRLSKNKLAYYRSQNKGKEWHSLIYGNYPDYQTAKSAAKKLKYKLGKNKPWIRKFKSIQNDIKNKDKQ